MHRVRQMGAVLAVTAALFVVDQATSITTAELDFSSAKAAAGSFPEIWIHGSKSAMDNSDPAVQVHAYNDHTFILRENKAINYEGAFMYLLFGNQKALLIDQGSTSSPALFPLRKIVDGVIREWEAKHGQRVELIVANSHLHGDHYAAWNQFVDRPNTIMVGLTHEEVMDYWGFTNYPEQRIEYDLGGRTLIVTGSPGHQSSELSMYDTWTHLLYTGDMFYRGRLYLNDWDAWAASIKRLRRLADEYPVTHLVNNHIEMTKTPKLDYPVGTTWQPDEPPMQMTLRMLDEAVRAVDEVSGPGIYKYDDFLIYNEIPWGYTTDP
ncbi:MAG: MBL fold metallo-hydrolase [Pseudomonadota bacterium]